MGNNDVFYECPIEKFIEKLQNKYTVEKVHDLCGSHLALGLAEHPGNLLRPLGSSFRWDEIKNSVLILLLIIIALFGAIIGLLALELSKIKKNVIQMDKELGRETTMTDTTLGEVEEEKES